MKRNIFALTAICLAGFASSQTFQPCKWQREAHSGDITVTQAINRFRQIFGALNLKVEGQSVDVIAANGSRWGTRFFQATVHGARPDDQIEVQIDAATGILMACTASKGIPPLSDRNSPEERVYTRMADIFGLKGLSFQREQDGNEPSILWQDWPTERRYTTLYLGVSIHPDVVTIQFSERDIISIKYDRGVWKELQGKGRVKITQAQALAKMKKIDPNVESKSLVLYWWGPYATTYRRMYLAKHTTKELTVLQVDAETGETSTIPIIPN